MKKLTLILALPAALAAQTVSPQVTTVFQDAITTGNNGVKMMARSTSQKPIAGRPLTANEERHSLQVLGDGTRIESKTVDKLYRDDQGRTRVEHQDGSVSIDDPVAGARAEINSNGKVIRTAKYSVSSIANVELSAKLKAELDAFQGRTISTTATASDSGRPMTFTYDVAGEPLAGIKPEAVRKAEQHKEENLGVQSANGVLSDGTRTTTSIPAGQIGNDRQIDIVSERWYSTDLQMLIKSVNKDPRFGETTYELTNIQQGAPDASLFKIPSRQ